MAIREPKINLSKDDKALLHLISQLLLQEAVASDQSNLEHEEIALSDAEAEKLLHLLEKLAKNPDFHTSERFLDCFANLSPINEKKAKTLFFEAKKRQNPEYNAVNLDWPQVKARLGVQQYKYMYKSVDAMSKEHFLRMEERLFQRLNIHPRVVSLLMDMCEKHLFIWDPLKHEFKYSPNSKFPKSILPKKLNGIIKRIRNEQIVCRPDLASVGFVLANSGTLFTTRDWTAAGCVSMMVGRFIESARAFDVHDQPK